MPLLCGAECVLAGPGAHRDPELLMRMVAEQGVTVLQLVPSLLEVALTAPAFPECASLRRVFCGGEVLSAALRTVSSPFRTPSCTTSTARRKWPSTPRTGPARGAIGGRSFRSAGRSPTSRSTSSTPPCSPFRVGVARRAAHRRRRPGARLSRPAGPDRGEVHSQPLLRPARRPPVPHRRPGALPAGRRASNSSAASTTRSSCAASASSWARSRRRWRSIRRSSMPSSWPARLPREARN